MNEIQLIRQNLEGERIVKIKNDLLKSSLARIVPTLFIIAGQQPDRQNVRIIWQELASDLQKRYKLLTLSEVEYVLLNGVKGEYGEYFGVNIVSINKWLRAYYNSDERHAALAERNRPALPQRTEPTEEEREQAFLDRYKLLLDTYRRDGRCVDYGNLVYGWLDKKGLVAFTNGQKNEFIDRARHELIREANERKIAVKIDCRIPFEVLLRNFKRELDEMSLDAKTRVIARAKQIALNEYFKKLIANEHKTNT